MKRVLVIEDEEGLLEGLAHNLRFEGYDVLTAKDGHEGLKMALKQKPDGQPLEPFRMVIGEELEAALDRALGYPDTDPHGDPIPGPDLKLPAETSRVLLELEPGDDAVICRVPDDAPLLRYLASLGMVPEARVRMVDKAPFDGPVSLEVDGIQQSLGVAVAGRIRVGPV